MNPGQFQYLYLEAFRISRTRALKWLEISIYTRHEVGFKTDRQRTVCCRYQMRQNTQTLDISPLRIVIATVLSSLSSLDQSTAAVESLHSRSWVSKAPWHIQHTYRSLKRCLGPSLLCCRILAKNWRFSSFTFRLALQRATRLGNVGLVLLS